MPIGPLLGLTQFPMLVTSQGTELFPFTTSLKTQVEPGLLEELHVLSVCAADRGYKTKFAFPCRPAWPPANIFWLTRAMMPAKVGATAEVPPTAEKLKPPAGIPGPDPGVHVPPISDEQRT